MSRGFGFFKVDLGNFKVEIGREPRFENRELEEQERMKVKARRAGLVDLMILMAIPSSPAFTGSPVILVL